MNSEKNKSIRAIVISMVALSFIVLIIAYFYYDNKNSLNDSRIVPARELYKNYNTLIQNNDLLEALQLMDSIEAIYAQYTHYKKSFENGVLNNNRAAIYLSIALYKDTVEIFYRMRPLANYTKDSLLNMAETELYKSIQCYSNWLTTYGELNEGDLELKIQEEFLVGIKDLDEKKKNTVLKNRISELLDAQTETKRRLSVSYTNLGVISRHRGDYEKAAENYLKALEHWEDNLSAENNLNLLLGRPLKKRNLLQKIFPKKK